MLPRSHLSISSLPSPVTSLNSAFTVSLTRPPSLSQAKKLAKSIAKAEKKEKRKKERKKHRQSSSSEDAPLPGAPTSGNNEEDFSRGSPARVAQHEDRSGASDRQRNSEPHHGHGLDTDARRPDRGVPAHDRDRQREHDDGRARRRREASPSRHESDGRRNRSRSPIMDRRHRR